MVELGDGLLNVNPVSRCCELVSKSDIKKKNNKKLRQEVWTFRGAIWEETIGQAGEDWKYLYQLCSRLEKAPAPVCPLLDKIGMHRYAAKDRVGILTDHIEQFTPHPALDSHTVTAHQEEVERRVRESL
ncbi:hypothetical protein EVAR_37407_1 [Eumeta japonica]|uniref:Uncharacterized protein n=1 Tax=Eumeta variegata TaxID=151549 RepID=A0A4C1WHP0_EUMVA|nr:hypothetical protein EVAR_37407_1 [Eumeta japonica]